MKKTHKRLRLVPHYTVLVLFSVWILLPLVWAITLSLKAPIDIVAIPNRFIFSPTLENYLSKFYRPVKKRYTLSILK